MKLYDATKGKKTVLSGGLLLVFEGWKLFFPDVLSDNAEMYIQKVISYLIFYGVTDRLWRNRKEIANTVKTFFKNKTNG